MKLPRHYSGSLIRCAVLLFLLVVFSCDSTSRRGRTVSSDAVALFSVGNVRVGKTRIKNGSVLKSDQVVRIGSFGLLDLQLRSAELTTTVRLTSGSVFSFSARRYGKKTKIELKLTRGSALFNVTRLAAREDLIVVTPTSYALVRGTKFETSVGRDGSATTRVYEGMVAARVRIPVVEDLPASVIDRSADLQSIVSTADAARRSVPAGSSYTTRKSKQRQVSNQLGLDKMIADKKLKRSLSSGRMTRREARKTVAMLDDFFKKQGGAGDLDKKVKQTLEKNNGSTAKISGAQTRRALVQFKEIVPVDQQKLKDEKSARAIVAARVKRKRKQLAKRIEKIFRKRGETILLRDGRRIYGVIEQSGLNYYVHKPSRRIFVHRNSVSTFRF